MMISAVIKLFQLNCHNHTHRSSGYEEIFQWIQELQTSCKHVFWRKNKL